MTHNIAVPANFFTASGARAQPQFIQNSLNWSQMPGAFTDVIAASDGTVWALLDTGGGPNYPIAHYQAGNWTTISGEGTRIAVSPNADYLYAVNSSGGVYQYNIANATWTGLGGGASDVTVGANNAVYVLANNGGDGAGDYPVYQYSNGTFTALSGEGSRISASLDPNTYTIAGGNINPGGFFITQSGSSATPGAFYYYSPGVGYATIPGAVMMMSAVTGGVFALSTTPATSNGPDGSVYFYETSSQGWTEEPGDGLQVAATNNTLYVVNSLNQLWTAPLVLKSPVISQLGCCTYAYNQNGTGLLTQNGSMYVAATNYGEIQAWTSGGTYTYVNLGSGSQTNSISPVGLALGADGALWFTDPANNAIGTTNFNSPNAQPSPTVTEYPIPTVSASPEAIVGGPDGNLWFTESNSSKIAKIVPSTGKVTEYKDGNGYGPIGIAVGSDGKLYVTNFNESSIAQITTSGTVRQFLTGTGGSGPLGITNGPDGALWFTEHSANNIGRMDTTGNVTEFPLPTASAGPTGIVTGSDGALWFTENNAQQIGRITTSGAISEYPASGSGGYLNAIAAAPDGGLWFDTYYYMYRVQFTN